MPKLKNMTKEKIAMVAHIAEQWEDANLSEMDTILHICADLELNFNIPFCVELRGSTDGGEYWLQVEYYSKKLKKTIIWNYDWETSFVDANELVDTLIETAKDIESFEKKISLKK